MSSESQNEMVHLLAQNVKKKITDEINSAGIFSVSADTIPDTSNQDKLVVAGRFVDSACLPHERVIEIKESVGKSGAGTAKDIIKYLKDNEIDVDMLSFQTYDFTASMSGRLNGAQKILQDMLERPVPYIPCQGHRSNTFNEHCCKESAIITSMYNVLEDIYVFFRQSTKRNKAIENATQGIENVLNFRNLSKTRWVYCSESIDAVWRNYEQIPKAIDEVVTADGVEPKVKAKGNGIKTKLLSFDFLFGLMFVRLIMKKTKVLTKQLQEEELNILDALLLIDATMENLKNVRGEDRAMDTELDAIVEFGNNMGIDSIAQYQLHHRPRRLPRRIDDHPEASTQLLFKEFYRKEMCGVLDSLITKYMDNVKVCLDQIKPLADGLQPPLQKPNDEKVKAMCCLFPPACRIEPQVLMSELEIFSTTISRKQPSSVQEATKYAHEYIRIFPTVCKTYRLLLTAPVSVAKDERTFSKLKIVKNCLRSTMKDKRLNELIILACEKDLTDSIDLNVVLDTWARVKMRKLPIKPTR